MGHGFRVRKRICLVGAQAGIRTRDLILTNYTGRNEVVRFTLPRLYAKTPARCPAKMATTISPVSLPAHPAGKPVAGEQRKGQIVRHVPKVADYTWMPPCGMLVTIWPFL